MDERFYEIKYFVFVELKILNRYFLDVCFSESMIGINDPAKGTVFAEFLEINWSGISFDARLMETYGRYRRGFGMWLIVRMYAEAFSIGYSFEINSKSKFLLVNLATRMSHTMEHLVVSSFTVVTRRCRFRQDTVTSFIHPAIDCVVLFMPLLCKSCNI